MASVWIIILVSTLLYLFWQDRRAAETAREYAKRHCEKLNVQFLSIACQRKRLGILKNGKPGLKTAFMWEFSSNGEDTYVGTLHLEDAKVISVDVPPHKLN